MTIPINDPSNGAKLTGHADWRTAVNALLDYWTANLRCFSSGEVAATLREHRPDLRFSVLSVGEHIRDLFYAQTLPQYPGPVDAVMVPRVTEGLFPNRTPAGIEVFVYGPEQQECLDHDFEVFIPHPGESQTDAPPVSQGQTAMANADKTGQTLTAVAILGAKVASLDIRAKVHTDLRLCVPRSAFELAVHLGGTPMSGGDPVWVKQDGDNMVIVTTDPNDPSYESYSLVSSRGRVIFPSPDATAPFAAGDAYSVSVKPGELRVDISQPV